MSSSVSYEYLQSTLNRPMVSAQNTNGTAITVIAGGTAVALPTRSYINAIGVNANNTQFTISQSGVYEIEYGIQTTASLAMSAVVLRNGTAIPGLTRTPTLSANYFTCACIVTLNANDVLQLTLTGLLGIATLGNGVGAFLNIKRIA